MFSIDQSLLLIAMKLFVVHSLVLLVEKNIEENKRISVKKERKKEQEQIKEDT